MEKSKWKGNYWKLLRKTNQKECRIVKVIKRKCNKL